ncbi:MULTISPECIES: DUF1523 family protein [Pseudomonas syringae group]|uniref:DUF1523 family protein n=1 Tax=Pseudomonas syringae group TaxID=136849 RepID=UPI0009874080|nr:DUF1523 domain-containing protein [Pseudomonas syringae pv. actinidiae]PIB87611.1 DUF1523 domain-containing protein [Pseudomonas syringae pv. actinidiae]PIH65332.1 DUF1523 domain-containing protein [Pseudomonas syringae pv. actinidiae]PIH70463.1 DUF1523 domain-containing protein [Pseudomonas syringae pv. actinidiae]PIH76176.1 DUF1523 domain-containing protein [Pseudomonas syringae pv. actinidiae]
MIFSRNGGIGWSFPWYFKFDSADIQALGGLFKARALLSRRVVFYCEHTAQHQAKSQYGL